MTIEVPMAELTEKGEMILSKFLSIYGAKGRGIFKRMFEGGALEGVIEDEENFKKQIEEAEFGRPKEASENE
jgi:hypothetical protein